MKRIIFALGMLTMLLPQLAFAHDYETNGTISALLHVEPNDTPVAGKPGSLYFFLTDKTNVLQPSKCICRVVVKDGSTTILDRPLFADLSDQPSGLNAQLPITFPKKASYDITLSATPRVAGTFAPFTFKYNEVVSRQAPPIDSIAMVAIVGIALIALGAFFRKPLIAIVSSRTISNIRA